MKVPEPRKLKSGSYFIQLRLDGVSVPVTASTARECKRQAELIKAEHRSGKRAVSSKQSLTLDKAIEAYIDSRRAVLSPSTINGYETIRRTRFLSHMSTRITDINWQAAINQESKLCSPKTLKNAYGLVVSVLAFCELPKPTAKLPQVIPADKAWLEPEQEMMELGGWSDTTTMHRIYTHVAQTDRLKSQNKMTDFFKNANENANETKKPL